MIKNYSTLTFLSKYNTDVTKNLNELVDLANKVETKEDLEKLSNLLKEEKSYKYKNGLLKFGAIITFPFVSIPLSLITNTDQYLHGPTLMFGGLVVSLAFIFTGLSRRKYVQELTKQIIEKFSFIKNELKEGDLKALPNELEANSAELTMGKEYKITRKVDGVWKGDEITSNYHIIDYIFSYRLDGMSGLNNLGKKSAGNAVKEIGKFVAINVALAYLGHAKSNNNRRSTSRERDRTVHKTRQFILMPTDINVPNFIVVSKTLEGLVDEPLRNNNMEYIKNGLNSSDLNKRFSVFSDNNKEFTSFMKPTVRKALLDLLKHDNDIIVQSYEGHISLGIGGKDMKDISQSVSLENPKEIAEIFESNDEQFKLLKDLGGFIETLHRMNDDNFK